MLQVGGIARYTESLDKGLEHEVAEKALVDMRVGHKEAKRLFCGRGGFLRNKRRRTTREFDEIIVADNCYKVLEVNGCVLWLCCVVIR